MKFVILMHSTPQPWGHPTADYVEASRALDPQVRAQLDREFDAMLAEISASGELVSSEALGDPATSTLFRWEGRPIASDGPYAESKEQFAGYFLVDVADRARAEQIAARFCGPGETVELRPTMWPGGEEG